MKRKCDYCGVEYVPKRNTSRFHSDECRRDYARAQKKIIRRFKDSIALISELLVKARNGDNKSLSRIKEIEQSARQALQDYEDSLE